MKDNEWTVQKLNRTDSYIKISSMLTISMLH